MWSPRLTLPEALTVRSTSVTSPDAGGSGGGPAGRAPAAARRARSRASSRDGRVLMRCPPSRTRTCLSPAQSRTVRPVIAGPGQTCCPAIQRLPDEGTSRPSPTALPCPLSLPGSGGGGAAAPSPGSGSPAAAGSRGYPVSSAGIRRPSPASERRPGAVAPRSHASTPRSPHLSRRRCGRVAQARRTRGTRRGRRGGRTRAPRIEAQLRCSTRVLAPVAPPALATSWTPGSQHQSTTLNGPQQPCTASATCSIPPIPQHDQHRNDC